MNDWRKQSEASLKLKQEQIDQLRSELEKSNLEKEKRQAELAMLRRNQKSFLNGKQVTGLTEDKNELEDRIIQLESDRQKEVEFWVQERTQMRDKIDRLESGGPGLLGKVYSSKPEEQVEPEMDQ